VLGGAARTSTSAVVWVCETPVDIGPALAEAVERLVSAFAGAESGSSPADMLALEEMDERLKQAEMFYMEVRGGGARSNANTLRWCGM
jgi:hypothetical protein